MKGFYNITDKIKTAFQAEPFTNTVSFGSIDDVVMGSLIFFIV